MEGYLGYSLNDGEGKAVGLIAVMNQKEIEDPETVSSILKIVAKRAEIELERITYEEQLIQNNAALLESNSQLLRLNKELESFTYVSSHDLQEPLRKIQIFANRILAKESTAFSEKGKDYFGRIQNAALRMQTLILDLLAYSHASIKDQRFEYTSMKSLVEQVIKDFSELISEKNAQIDIGDLDYANIVPLQFKLVISNLISNAINSVNRV